MIPRALPILLAAVLVGALTAATRPATAEPLVASDLLLPYFEVDVESFNLTTLFAVGNSGDEAVEVEACVYTNWGIEVLCLPLSLAAHEVKTVNLRDWLSGNLPGRPMNSQQRGHLNAALRGLPSPLDDLYYGTEVAPNLAVGYVTLRTQGIPRPAVLFGDFFIVDPQNDFAQGESLVVLDRGVRCIGACLRHAVRFLEGGGFDGGTELILWTPRRVQPSASPYFPQAMKVETGFDAYEQPGQFLDHRQLDLLPVQILKVSELTLPEPFGWLEVTTELESFLSVRYSAAQRFSLALTTFCLPDPPPEVPQIRIEKATNGHDADAAPGPQILPGSGVEWAYAVTNSGSVPLSEIAVSDDLEGAISCPRSTLAPGESMVCTQGGTARACQYRNVGEVTGLAPDGQQVSDQDPSHYFGSGPADIRLEKATNGHDADAAPGPTLTPGSPVTWTYTVTNTGEVELLGVAVTDDREGAVPCPKNRLAPGESMTCTQQGVAGSAPYANLGTVTARTACDAVVQAEDPSHYRPGGGGIDVEKATNGHDADAPTGPVVPVGSHVTWTYLVRNTGQVPLSQVAVTDSDPSVAVSCPRTTLAAGETMTCQAGAYARACQYSNLATATGRTPTGTPVEDTDPSHYFGEGHAGIRLEKDTNGYDADAAPGPEINLGASIVWTYAVTNTGDVPLANVRVSDDREGAVSCPKSSLAPGETMLCRANGTAVAGNYANLGTATGRPPCGPEVSDTDPSHYHNPLVPGIRLEKATDGHDADAAPGPQINAGAPVTWTYRVTNTGQVRLTGVRVTDSDTSLAVSCPKSSLEPGESMTCSAYGTAQPCQYENLGTAVGTAPDGALQRATDPSHYFGKTHPAVQIEKATDGRDADYAPGPEIDAGSPVAWTYQVTNTGDAQLTGIAVSDDRGVAVSCPQSSLAPGASMTCTGSGIAVAGQYRNVGTVTARSVCGGTARDDDPSHYYGRSGGGGQGCTPGYWKNHTDSWPPTGYSPGQPVESVFGAAAAYPEIGDASLLAALAFQGGSGVEGAARNLLRAAVAALLDAAHPGVGYPRSTSQVIGEVDAALASGNRDTMLSVASALDRDNNLGCPLN